VNAQAGPGNAQGATVELVGGDLVFTPTQNFIGVASFDYTISDTSSSPISRSCSKTIA
jgi:hypothetical protein